MKVHNRCGNCLDPNAPLTPIDDGSNVMMCGGCGSKMEVYRIGTSAGPQLVYFTKGEEQERIDWHCGLIRDAAHDLN